ncbi:MAG: CooT family nickel-binding protein [Nitrososphaerota archaeon]|nr:CooT family nickel-binding protein [Nitrososphaerota archaeon]
MCEFNVILNGKIQIKDVIYAKTEADKVVVKDIMGKAMEFTDCKISEVDVPNARLVLHVVRMKVA